MEPKKVSTKKRRLNDAEIDADPELDVTKLTGYARQWAEEAMRIRRERRVLGDQMQIVKSFARSGSSSMSGDQVQELLAIHEDTQTAANQLIDDANKFLKWRVPTETSSQQWRKALRASLREEQACEQA